MKKRKFAIALVFFFLVSMFMSSVNFNDRVEAATTKIGVVDITSGSLNVRSGAGKQYKVVGSLKKGQRVTVYSQSKSGWSEIRYNKVKAFVSTPYLRFYSLMSINGAKNITDKILRLERKTWEKSYTEKQIFTIMAPNFTTDYIGKYFKQQYRKDGLDHYGNQLFHINETEIWGYAIEGFDWQPKYEPKPPSISHYYKDGKEYLIISQYHLNEESGNHTSILYLFKSTSTSNWKVFNYVTK